MGFPGSARGKEPANDVRETYGDERDAGSVPGLGRYPGGRNGNPLQYSCLENPMDGGAWYQSSLWAGSLRYRAWAQSWSSAALAASLVAQTVKTRPAMQETGVRSLGQAAATEQ